MLSGGTAQSGSAIQSLKNNSLGRVVAAAILLLSSLLFLCSCGREETLGGHEETVAPEVMESMFSVLQDDIKEQRMEEEAREREIEAVLSSYQNLGIVQCSSYINFRSKPDQTDIRNIMGMLNNGAAVDILQINPEGGEGWAYVRSGGKEGYVISSCLIQGEEAKALARQSIKMRVTVLADRLRIRRTPEIADGNTVGSAAKGEKYYMLGMAGEDWVEIVPDNIDGVDHAYMSASSENVLISEGLDEARSLDLRQKVLNMYDMLGVSKASDYVNIRKTPEEDGINNIVGKFPGFAGANILGEENGWYKIQSGKVTGYVRSDLVATGAEAETLAVENASVMAIVNTEALNVRSEPTTESQAWTQIAKGQRYMVLNQLDGWVQLELDSGDDEDGEQGAFVSTRDNNVSVTYALQQAIEYYPAVEAANAAAAFRNKIVNFACQFVGNRYVWGGTSLTKGCDCSGFTQSVMANFGIYLPRVSSDQARSGSRVTSSSMKPGDLVFYANRRGSINHVAIYIGNGQVISAASRRLGIRITAWNYRTPVGIRNVIGE